MATTIVDGVIADARGGSSGNTAITGGDEARAGNTMTGVSAAAPRGATTDVPALVWMNPTANAAPQEAQEATQRRRVSATI